jgi:N-formylglutamate amidohydrolase
MYSKIKVLRREKTGSFMVARHTVLSLSGHGADPVLDDLRARPILLLRPLRQISPLIFASPHSGSVYPPSFVRQTRLDPLTLRKSEDAFVDELFGTVSELGAPLLAARFPRALVDVNRAPGEIDASMFDGPVGCWVGPRTPRVAAGLGVIPRIVRDGVEIYAGRLPARDAAYRLEHFYRPYHAALARLVAETRECFGTAIVVDCHSMPPPVRGTEIVIGDCYGESSAPSVAAEAHRNIAGLGFSVARNAPYAGGYTTKLYGKPEAGLHALQIEVSRALYLHEASLEKTGDFAHARERLCRFAKTFISNPWLELPRRQAAAE